MTNPRDTGRYDAIEQEYIDQQVRIDFAWGNIPMQPNDDRGEDTLDPELDSHIIATSGYQNFPAFTTGSPYDDTVENITVPNVVGLSQSAAQSALAAAGLDYETTTTETGANSGNDGKVKTQSPAAGTSVNAESTVDLVVYENPAVTVPNVVDFDSVSAAAEALVLEGLTLGTVTTSTEGATTGNWGWVKSQNPAANTSVAPGTAVNLVSYDYVSAATTGSISGFQRTAISSLGGSLNGNETVMYVTGRSTWPAVGSTITVTGSSAASYNATYTVVQVAQDDAYNTGGTAIKVGRTDGLGYSGVTSSSGGTWSKGIAASGTSLRSGRNWALEGGTYAYFGAADTIPTLSAILANPTLVSVDYAAGGYAGVSDATLVDGGSTLRLGLVGNIGTFSNTVGDLWTGSYPTDPTVSSSNLSIIAN